ncbi:phosphatase PAP2 family protein [Changpingibacter yushuensis]|uniref:phosphatase PAP2 family protein n=1 Tax=Changpingibacter yushuensis TaxID=2758440 RepID=UPI0015F6B6A3|nr:phosphatase PAP2 family protein [Changpingibacter yushuensis]
MNTALTSRHGKLLHVMGSLTLVAALAMGNIPAAQAASYDSDATIDQIVMFSDYDNLTANYPSAIKQNQSIAVSINNANYNTSRAKTAVSDASIKLSNVSPALGTKLGAYFNELLSAGKLPKTKAMLEGETPGMEVDDASSKTAKTHFNVARPFTSNIGIKKVSSSSVYSVGALSFPSGHARTFQVEALGLATLLPELAPQLLARGAEGGESRVVLGVHYPLDVIAGKAMGTRMVAQRWADKDYRTNVILPAQKELRAALESKCGMSIAKCVASDTAWKSDEASVTQATSLMTFGFTKTGKSGVALEVPEGAEDLLLTTFPNLTDEQRRQVLALTATDSGYPLDLSGATKVSSKVTSEDIGWTRLNLATAMTSTPIVQSDGSIKLSTGSSTTESSTPSATPSASTSPSASATATSTPTPTTTTAVPPLTARYRSHVASLGWLGYVESTTKSGDGKHQIEAIRIKLDGVQVRAHVQKKGWTSWVGSGETAGTTGKALRAEAISIKLTGTNASKYDIYYRVEVDGLGWLGWAKNGANAGTTGYAKKMLNYQVVVVAKGSAAPGSTSGAVKSK